MLGSNFNTKYLLQHFFITILIVALVGVSVPVQYVSASEDIPITESTDSGSDVASSTPESNLPEEDTVEEPTASSTPEVVVEVVDTQSATSTAETATSTAETATSTPETATSTSGTAGAGTDNGQDGSSSGDGTTDGGSGEDGGTGTEVNNGETATSTVDTATSTPTTGEGTIGEDGEQDPEQGNDGSEGGSGESGATATESTSEADSTPVPVVTANDIGDKNSPDDPEDSTGGITQTGRNTEIYTGNATARGEVGTDVNSNNIRSIDEKGGDLDVYSFNATGTNEAVVGTTGTILSSTGDNTALSTSASGIYTGNAFSALNIANVVNSNIINSDGFLYLLNKQLEPKQSLDLTDFFFPDPESTFAAVADCNLLSCRAEDIEYTFSQKSDAVVTNEATIKAETGENEAEGDYAVIETGDAYAGANVINVVNTNIIDSNYRLLTLNAMGDLEGDLMLPTEDLFKAFFGRPNGMTQTESAEEIDIRINNTNDATVENNVETYAETGLNESTTVFNSNIKTGNGESETNVVNKVNRNVYGGDSMYLLIRIHGNWSGDVVGLPEGLTWSWTPDGILIYNEGAEITPSTILPYDVDSYSADIVDMNTATVTNNINIDAVTGKNTIDGLVGSIETGDAFASANVMNIVNTNIIGVNWTMAVVNIFGDFDGNVTFSQTDVSLEGEVSSADDPLEPGGSVSYLYTITNNGDISANNVTLTQTLQNAQTTSSTTQEVVALGTLAPGESVNVTLTAIVDSNIPVGTTTVSAVASVTSDESDGDESNNASLLTVVAQYNSTTTDDNETGTTTDAVITDDDTSTTTDSGPTDTQPPVIVGNNNSGGGGGGGGGGGSKTKTKSVDRIKKYIDPDSAPLIFVTKKADVKENQSVTAGEDVDYTIKVRNGGGAAYDATVYDTLRNPIGSIISEQSWDLGTILPGEEIKLTYTTTYDLDTPSGIYTNTASIKAYRASTTKESGGRPLKLDDAVHTIVIQGVPLAVGNVGMLAYFPASNGQISALMTWETSTSSTGQVYYSPMNPLSSTSPYSATALNYGYAQTSYRFPNPKIKHLMILTGLKAGTEYTYRIQANSGPYSAQGGDYTFTVPYSVRTLTLAGYKPTTRVAGASISKPVEKPKVIAPSPASVPYVKPKTVIAPPPVVTEPDITPEPEYTPEPEPKQEPKKKGFGGFIKKVFGFWR